jgi:hypothetical protein
MSPVTRYGFLVSADRPDRCQLYAVPMPRRSTPFQAIVHLVRQHYAGPGVTVTESKFLDDPVLGPREVDIIVEAEADGDPVIISLEVNERSRPASVEWVEQQIGKHRRLPTNKLVLVSKAGFTGMALTTVASENGKVEAIKPEIAMVDGEPVVRRLFADSVSYNPTRYTVHAQGDDDTRIEVIGGPDTAAIYDAHGAFLGPLAFLVRETVGLGWVGHRLSVEAHHHPEREGLKTFELKITIDSLGYRLKREDTGALYQILALEIWGDFTYRQDEVTLTLSRLGDRVYAAGEGSFAGRPSVRVVPTWKSSMDPNLKQLKIRAPMRWKVRTPLAPKDRTTRWR